MHNIYDVFQLALYILGTVALIQVIYMNHVSIFDFWFGEGEDEHES